MSAHNTRCVKVEFALIGKDESVCAISVILTIQRDQLSPSESPCIVTLHGKKTNSCIFRAIFKILALFNFFLFIPQPLTTFFEILRSSAES